MESWPSPEWAELRSNSMIFRKNQTSGNYLRAESLLRLAHRSLFNSAKVRTVGAAENKGQSCKLRAPLRTSRLSLAKQFKTGRDRIVLAQIQNCVSLGLLGDED